MGRVRISTTVDADALEAARRRLGRRDSELIDEALGALLDALDAEADAAALAASVYQDDDDTLLRAGRADGGRGGERRGAADVVELASRRRAPSKPADD